MASRLADGSIQLNDGRVLYANSVLLAADLLEVLPLVTPPPSWPFVSGGGGGGSGTPGVRGADGRAGTQGPQGPGIGNTGPQGNQGNQGTAGTTGTNGTQGSQGPAGSGAQGHQGPSGGAGSQGNQGPAGGGAQGNQGNQGIAGTSGTSGTQGTQGNQGPLGATGIDFVWGFPGNLVTNQNFLILDLTKAVPVQIYRFDVLLKDLGPDTQPPSGGDVIVEFLKEGVLVATVTVPEGQIFGSFTPGSPVAVAAGERMTAQIVAVGSTLPGQTATMIGRVQ